MKLRNLVLFVAMIVMAFAFSACGGSEPPAGGQQGTSAPTGNQPEAVTQPNVTEPTVEGAITWVSMSAPPSLDPIRSNDSATGDFTMQVFEGLMWYNPHGHVLEPLLAESVNQVDDLTFVFNLRQGVYFHDGTPLNADAVKLSLDRPLNPEENPVPGRFVIDMIDQVTVIDDHTVQITVQFPFTPLLAHLTHQVAYIIAPAAIEEERSGGRPVSENPIGTGPFMFDEQVPGEFVRITPNPNHWRATPAHDVYFRNIPDASTRLAMVQSGEANAMIPLASDFPILPTLPNIEWWEVEATGLTYVGFNTQKYPLDNMLVRRAITMAIDTNAILFGVQEGVGIPAVGPIRGGAVMHAPTDLSPLPFDVEAARALMEEAGYPDGLSISIWTNDNAVRVRIAQIVQDNLRAIGVDLDIVVMEWGAYLEDTSAGLHDMFILGWSTLTGDADYGVYIFHSSQISDPNRFFYANPQVDALLDEGRMSTDPARRDVIYREVSSILIEEAPLLFLFHPNHLVATNGVNGVIVDPNQRPHFAWATLR
jgi:peptide/nickel transport system substrate-binding protein